MDNSRAFINYDSRFDDPADDEFPPEDGEEYPTICPVCFGIGEVPWNDPDQSSETCPRCNGSGTIMVKDEIPDE